MMLFAFLFVFSLASICFCASDAFSIDFHLTQADDATDAPYFSHFSIAPLPFLLSQRTI